MKAESWERDKNQEETARVDQTQVPLTMMKGQEKGGGTTSESQTEANRKTKDEQALTNHQMLWLTVESFLSAIELFVRSENNGKGGEWITRFRNTAGGNTHCI